MALTPQEQQKLNDLLKEGIELAKKLGLAADEASLKNFTGDLTQAERIVKSLRDEWQDYVRDIAGAREGFARIVDEIKGINSGINRSKTAFSGLTSLAAKLQNHTDGTNRLSAKELEKLKQQAKQREDDLKLAGKLAKDRVKELENKTTLSKKEKRELEAARVAHANISQEITRNAGHLRQFNTQLNHNIDIQKQIEKSLGVTGALMKGMSKIPFLGDLPGMSGVLGEVEEEIREIEEREGRIVGKSEAMRMAFKKMGPIIKEGLTDPLVVGGFLLNQLKDIFLSIDTGAGNLAKNMNMSYKEALDLRGQLSNIATLSGDVALNTKGLDESYQAINSALGTNAEINEKDLKTFTKLREQAGYTNDELVSMYKISQVTGKNVEDTTKEFLGGAKAMSIQKGLAINVKQLMKETSNVSNAIKLSIAGGAKGLAEAAVKAKEMGISLEQADKIANSLLQFEDSIGAELEAELLTNKQINLETARLAALNNDIGKMAEEINSQIGGSAEFSKMHRIEQESYAKAVGMSREELANSLVEQEALAKTGSKTTEEAKKKYDLLRQTMTAEEAAAALGDEQLAKQYEQQSIQERFTQAVEKLKDVFVTIVDGPLGVFMGMIADILSNSYVLYGVIGALAGLMAGRLLTGIMGVVKAMRAMKIQSLGSAILSVIKGAWETFGPIPIIGAGLAAAAAIAGVAYVKNQESSAQPVNDGMISPDGGLVVSGEKGTYKLNANDTVIAGTELGKSSRSGGGNTSNSEGNGINYDLLASKIASAIASMPPPQVVLRMDGKQVAESVNQTNLQTQVKTQ